jgi:hypothetical protein
LVPAHGEKNPDKWPCRTRTFGNTLEILEFIVTNDRRVNRRKCAKFSLLLLPAGLSDTSPISAETEDVSNGGFSCTTARPFVPGERLRCLISLNQQPAPPAERGSPSFLEGMIEVVRVGLNHNGFSLACRIYQSRVVAADALPTWASPV